MDEEIIEPRLSKLVDVVCERQLPAGQRTEPTEDENYRENVFGSEDLRYALKKLRYAVKRIFYSTKLRKELKHICYLREIKFKIPKRECKTRWNYLVDMIRSCLEIKDALDGVMPTIVMKAKDTRVLKTGETLQLNAYEWHMMKEFADFLDPFREVTVAVSAEKTPTIHLVLPYYVHLLDTLKGQQNTMQTFVKKAAKAAYDKLHKYFLITDGDAYIFGPLLDPRQKLKFFQTFSRYYSAGDVAKFKSRFISRFMKEYYHDCETENEFGASEAGRGDSESANASSSSLGALLSGLTNDEDMDNLMSEAECYLNEKILPWTDDFDILKYWKGKNEHPSRTLLLLLN